jgi:hypothetical protein
MSEYRPMVSSVEIDKIVTALAAAQGAFPEIICDLQAGGKGGRTYMYASLQNVLSSTRKSLSDNGIVFTQTIIPRDGMTLLVTMLLHSSGQYIASEYPMNLPGDPQSAGSMMTYFRRYSAIAILGVHPDYDDDGKDGGGDKHQNSKAPDGQSQNREQSKVTKLPNYTLSQARENTPKWAELIASGKSTPEKIISMISAKFIVSDEIKKRIMDLKTGETA